MNKYLQFLLLALTVAILPAAHADEPDAAAEDTPADTMDRKHTFQEKKTRQIERLEARLTCLRAADDKKELKDCRRQMKKDRKERKKADGDAARDKKGKGRKERDMTTDTATEESMEAKEKSADEMKDRKRRDRKNRTKPAETESGEDD